MKVLITRPRSQSIGFGRALQTAGFEPVYFPVIEIRPVENNPALDNALARLDRYAWIVFTSVNAVEVVFDRLSSLSMTGLGAPLRLAAIGPKTSAALQAHGVSPTFVPETYVAESILPGLGDLRHKWVLLPRAEIARKALPEAIVAAGGTAHEIAVYRTLPAQVDPAGLASLQAGVDWITFTSPSTVQNFVEILHRRGMDPFRLAGTPKIACIGPITERAAFEQGFEVDLVAEKYTTEGLIKAISGGRPDRLPSQEDPC